MNIKTNDFMFFLMATSLFWSTDRGAQIMNIERKLEERSSDSISVFILASHKTLPVCISACNASYQLSVFLF